MDSPSKPRIRFLNKPLYFWARLTLGAIFLAASIDKIHHPEAFAQIVYNYRILPDLWVNLTAIVLPWTELILGILLIAGLWLPGAVLLSNMMLSVFFCLLVTSILRGLDVEWGCFSSRPSEDAAYLWYILRDLLFLLLAVYLLFNVIIQGHHEPILPAT